MAAKRRGGLGKGLDSLIRDKSSLSDSSKNKTSSTKTPKESKSQADLETEIKHKNVPKIGSDVENNIHNDSTNGVNPEIELQNGNNNGNKMEVNFNTSETISVSDTAPKSDYYFDFETDKNSENNFSPVSKDAESEDEFSSVKIDSEAEKDLEAYNASYISNTPAWEAKKEEVSENEKGDSVLIMKISSVEPNREQPRKHFSEEGIEELASSIKQYGIIQPLLVQKRDDYYEIIAGERRWRAAMKAGLKEVPVIVKDYSNREAVEISLIENIQREDLNPIEEALAYDRLIQEFEMTQEQVAGRVSKSRSAVTNSLRLLKLDAEVRQMVISGELSEGHARTLLGLPNEEMQKLLADRIIKEKLSVRDTEKLVKKLTTNTQRKQKTRDYQKEAILENLSEQLKVILGTKVSITEKGKSKGKIEIEYYSDDELNRIFEILQSVRKIEY